MTAKEDIWQAVFEQEEGELFILSLVEEILNKSQNVLFEKHIDGQLLPYAVQATRKTLVSIIDVCNIIT